MDINTLKSLNADPNLFKGVFKKDLKEAFLNHPKIKNTRRLAEIFEEINSLNNRVTDLLNEAESISTGVISEKYQGSDKFNSNPDSLGMFKDYENVDYVAVHDMDQVPQDDLSDEELPVKPSKLGDDWVNQVFAAKPIVIDRTNRLDKYDNEE